MTTALWIIAVCEVIRILQNSLQLTQLFASKKIQKNLNSEFISSLKKDDKEWVKDLLDDFVKESEKNAN